MDCAAARLLVGVSDRIAGLAKACDGATAVETAFVLPVFLLLLFSIIEGGLLFWTQSTLQFAVESAARCAAVNTTICGTSSAIVNYAVSQAYGMTIPSSAFTVSNPCGGGGPQSYQVTASYVFSFIVAEVYPAGNITLTATSRHP